MAAIQLEITDVRDSGNYIIEADEVRFIVVYGEPTEQEISDYLYENTTSTSNLMYWKDEKKGMFVDLNFEFKKGKKITFKNVSQRGN